MTVKIYNKWDDIRQASSATSQQDDAHGLSSQQIGDMADRFNKFLPSLAGGHSSNAVRDQFTSNLPKGANWTPGRSAQSMTGPNGSGNTMYTQQTPYAPEFASPDRQQYPVHRILANRYWRLFYKLDPVIGNCMDLYSELPWSNFELTGDGVEGEIRQTYEHMCRETQILAMLPYFVKEFLVLGECIPHTFFSDEKGIFTHVSLHNPDQLEIIDAPFIKMDPIIQFIPDDRLRSVLTSDQPALRGIRDSLPPELLSKLQSRENITLSPINATFIPRKMHPYDTRGTSILSRMWRVLMLEDAIFNASLQTARRNSAPLKVAKLGNAATGWIPPPEQEKRLLELLAQAEHDPAAWLVYHYGIQFETIGTNDRAMSISREWDIIERIKLVAMGISRAFVHGEVTYASSATGLQVFLQRLKALRMMFEQKWLYPKFFKPVAEINGWIKPKPNEVQHRYRVKRSAKEIEEQNLYIVPKIVWDKTLDPQINTELIGAMTALEALGVKFSKTSKMASVGFSFEEETKKIYRESQFEKTYLPKVGPQPDAGAGGGGAPPMGGGGAPPPPPGGDMGLESPGQEAPPGGDGEIPPGVEGPPTPPTPEGASLAVKADDDKDMSVETISRAPGSKSNNSNLVSEIWVDDKFGNWHADEVSDLLDLIKSGKTDSAFFMQLGADDGFGSAMTSGDMDAVFDVIDGYLQSKGYPDKDISELHNILQHEGVLDKPLSAESQSRLLQLDQSLPDNASDLDDNAFAQAVSDILKRDNNKIANEQSNLLTGH